MGMEIAIERGKFLKKENDKIISCSADLSKILPLNSNTCKWIHPSLFVIQNFVITGLQNKVQPHVKQFHKQLSWLLVALSHVLGQNCTFYLNILKIAFYIKQFKRALNQL